MLSFACVCPKDVDCKCNKKYSQSLRAVKFSFAANRALLLQYMVKRKGLDFTEYGLVDARAAKRQRLSGDGNDPKYILSPHVVENSVLSFFLQSLCSVQLVCQPDYSVLGIVLSFTIRVVFKAYCVLCEDLSSVIPHKRHHPSSSCCQLATAVAPLPLLFCLVHLLGMYSLAVNLP